MFRVRKKKNSETSSDYRNSSYKKITIRKTDIPNVSPADAEIYL